MKIDDSISYSGKKWFDPYSFGTLLFDLAKDPGQKEPLQNKKY